MPRKAQASAKRSAAPVSNSAELDEAGKLASVNAVAHDLAAIRTAIRHELRSIGVTLGQREQTSPTDTTDIAARFERLSAAYEEQSALLDELFDLTRDAFLEETREEPFRLDELIARLAASFAGVARSRGAQLSCNAAAFSVVADRRKLMRLLTNLLLNAIRHSAARTIHLAAEQANGTVTLSVSDDGTGLALGVNALLDATTTPHTVRKLMRVTAGGNGYYIVRRLAQRIGAQLSVSANAPSGTRIAVALACAAQTPSTLVSVNRHEDRRTQPVWVIEPDTDERLSIAALFEQHGLRTVAAADAAFFIQSSSEGSAPQLIVLQFAGAITLASLHQLQTRLHEHGSAMPPLVLLGGMRDTQQVPAAFDAFVIDKPVDAQRVAAVTRALADARATSFSSRLEHAYQQTGLRRWRHVGRLLDSASELNASAPPAAT